VPQGFFHFQLSTEEIMVALPSASSGQATATTHPPANIQELAERGLRSNPYLVLKNISCAWVDGVLVLRGCVPTYYLKQIAQQVVASLEGVARIDNQIQVVTPAFRPAQG
jgi:osmotically-inducible protein OsmY